MNQTERLLQNIIENGRMGADACDQLMSKTHDEALRQELMNERDLYEGSVREAEKMLAGMGMQAKPKGMMARAGMWMGMQMDTIMDKSPSHIADILIRGLTMGIVEITKARNSNPDASAEAQGVAAALITSQQEGIDRLKVFLTQYEKAKV